ncbi:MAG: 6-phosphogluconolactonase [Mycobacterium sp.]|nr:6-phosphogluconolactonase [Mycobacterium sp.]
MAESSSGPNVTVDTYPDAEALVQAAGDRLAAAIATAITERGLAWVVLTGGGNGIGMLKVLGGHPVDWARVHLFWGDDRFVAHDDEERNEKQARAALLDRIDIPSANIHPMPPSDGEFGDDIDAAAGAYERMLAEVAASTGTERGQATPVFDVHLLGMGGEGHINSLFPHTDAVREADRMVVAVTDSPKPPPRRITLTLPAVRRSRQVWLLVSGAAKSGGVAAAVAGADPIDWPAAGARGNEQTIWFLDSAAASELSH